MAKPQPPTCCHSEGPYPHRDCAAAILASSVRRALEILSRYEQRLSPQVYGGPMISPVDVDNLSLDLARVHGRLSLLIDVLMGQQALGFSLGLERRP